MSGEIVQFNEVAIKNELRELVKCSVEETLNGLYKYSNYLTVASE